MNRIDRPTGLLLLLACLPITGFSADDSAEPASFLTFESVLDGRCQILSEGGKLQVMRNEHPDKAIAFRLTRVFAGVPQGLSTGVAEPAAEMIKLGCTRVDGRKQEWRVNRARFEPQE